VFHSLRFRLPALFFTGIVLAGIVTSALAIRLFQDYASERSYADLRHEARGITKIFGKSASELPSKPKKPSARFATKALEEATGDSLLYAGAPILPGEDTGIPQLKTAQVPGYDRVKKGMTVSFELTLPRSNRRYIAVANPVRVGARGPVFGALIVATPKADVSHQVRRLIDRLALALLGGLLVAMGLAWYLSRRIARPLRALANAADKIARRRYDVDIPEARRRDEVGHLAARFTDMAVQLREASELERNFLMTVSHELKTPLTAIRGHVTALREGIADDPAVRAVSLGAIAEETERLERLVGDILDLAKLEANRFTVRREEIDMERLVDRAYAAFDQEARQRGIEYDRTLGAKPTIVSDGDRVLQILTNLLSNAFKWTPDGGRVEVALGAANGSVSVAVADTGPGIAPDERERIFRPFWTGDGRGTGLGLAIARELAVALGGTIEVDSDPGHGSRFRLLLPKQPEFVPEIVPAAASGS
jgi:signal transduction histidine kinase